MFGENGFSQILKDYSVDYYYTNDVTYYHAATIRECTEAALNDKHKLDYFFIEAIPSLWAMVESVDEKIDFQSPLITCGVINISPSRLVVVKLFKKFNSITVAVDIEKITKGREKETIEETLDPNISTETGVIIGLLVLILRWVLET